MFTLSHYNSEMKSKLLLPVLVMLHIFWQYFAISGFVGMVLSSV